MFYLTEQFFTKQQYTEEQRQKLLKCLMCIRCRLEPIVIRITLYKNAVAIVVTIGFEINFTSISTNTLLPIFFIFSNALERIS